MNYGLRPPSWTGKVTGWVRSDPRVRYRGQTADAQFHNGESREKTVKGELSPPRGLEETLALEQLTAQQTSHAPREVPCALLRSSAPVGLILECHVLSASFFFSFKGRNS